MLGLTQGLPGRDGYAGLPGRKGEQGELIGTDGIKGKRHARLRIK